MQSGVYNSHLYQYYEAESISGIIRVVNHLFVYYSLKYIDIVMIKTLCVIFLALCDQDPCPWKRTLHMPPLIKWEHEYS